MISLCGGSPPPPFVAALHNTTSSLFFRVLIYFIHPTNGMEETNDRMLEEHKTQPGSALSFSLTIFSPFSVFGCRLTKGMNTSTTLRWRFAVAQLKSQCTKRTNSTATVSIAPIEYK